MENREIEKILEELQNVEPELLSNEARKLFKAIIRLANERNFYKKKYEDLIEYYKRSRDCNEEFEL